MWELDSEESWAPKNWCFWTVVLEKTLGVPWTARRSNQSILKEISPEYSLEGLMLKLKLQYFGHLMQRVDSFEKTLMLGGIGGQKEKGMIEDEMAGWHHWLDGCEFGWAPGVGGVLWFMESQRVGHDWATELNWKTEPVSSEPKWGNAGLVFISVAGLLAKLAVKLCHFLPTLEP